MILSEIVQAAKFKITEGSEFLWNCFGNNARYLDFSTKIGNSGASCVFDADTQQVYKVEIYSSNNKWYRWIDEDFIQAIKKESAVRDVDFSQALDDTQWIELDNVEDVFRKTTQVIESGICDDDVTITLDLDRDLLLELSLMAHERNITLNTLIVEVIQNAVDYRSID